ncbi:MAG TPA: prolyl oligopeptidase family serine peptidase [Flavitalea sp.]|nr:prolyl oligopeptidase family serine peptidase [Flavitalea sp.]
MRLGLFRYVFILFIITACTSCKKSNIVPVPTETPANIPDTIPANTEDSIPVNIPDSTIEETLPPTLSAVTVNINDAVKGYYKALPSKYDTSEKNYPLLIFLHGGGGFGNGQIDLPLLLNEGIPLLLDEKIFPPEFVVNDEHFSFIHLAPQFSREPTPEEVMSFIRYAIENFRIDSSRIYLTGMSNGGKITCNVAERHPEAFAAIVAMAGVSDTTDLQNKCASIVNSELPVWVFHNDQDQVSSVDASIKFIDAINDLHPAIAPRFTIFPSEGLLGHDAWTRATDPRFKEDNRNIYEWMLQYRRILQ